MTDVHRRARYLGLQLAGLIVAMLAIVSLLTLTVYERTEHRDANATLRAAASTLSVDQVPPGFWMLVDAPPGTSGPPERLSGPSPAGLPVASDLTRVRADGRPRQRELSTASGTWFVRTERRGPAVVQVAMDRSTSEKATRRVVSALLVSGILGVLLAGGIAALLAHRAITPITDALAMQRRFVADAGHELRTPLTLLSTRVQMLSRRLSRDPDTPPDVRKDLAGVLDDTAALTSILEDLLVAAEPGAPSERSPCDLGALVVACVDAAAASAGERGVDLTVGSVDRAEVPASVGAVRRAVTSLVDNALDHARTSVRVDVSLRRKDAQVSVTDDGPGVPETEAERIFERFASMRAPQAPSGHYGLGLALVADVAAAHGGSVAVTDRPDGTDGARFVLTLPR